MTHETVEVNYSPETVAAPLIWRLGPLFNVTTNIRRARVSSERGLVALDLDGSTAEIESARQYLKAVTSNELSADRKSPPNPEDDIPQPSTIKVRLTAINAGQAAAPVLARIARDYRVVTNIGFAAIDEEGGTIEVEISGALLEVQRAISYLHTTGLQVSPYQRSVSDNGNL